MKTALLNTNPKSELMIRSLRPLVSDQGPAKRAKITEGMAWKQGHLNETSKLAKEAKYRLEKNGLEQKQNGLKQNGLEQNNMEQNGNILWSLVAWSKMILMKLPFSNNALELKSFKEND